MIENLSSQQQTPPMVWRGAFGSPFYRQRRNQPALGEPPTLRRESSANNHGDSSIMAVICPSDAISGQVQNSRRQEHCRLTEEFADSRPAAAALDGDEARFIGRCRVALGIHPRAGHGMPCPYKRMPSCVLIAGMIAVGPPMSTNPRRVRGIPSSSEKAPEGASVCSAAQFIGWLMARALLSTTRCDSAFTPGNDRAITQDRPYTDPDPM